MDKTKEDEEDKNFRELTRKTHRRLKRELLKSLHYGYAQNEDGMRKQMRALDLCFRELLTKSINPWAGNLEDVRTALQAQNQFRSTMNTLTFLKLMEKRTPSPLKNDEQTDQDDSLFGKGVSFLGRAELRRIIDEAIQRKINAIEAEAGPPLVDDNGNPVGWVPDDEDQKTSSLRAIATSLGGSEAIQSGDENWIASSAQEGPPRNDGKEF